MTSLRSVYKLLNSTYVYDMDGDPGGCPPNVGGKTLKLGAGIPVFRYEGSL